MLENNHLFKQIQHRNIFRTFSRAYSRPIQDQRFTSNSKNRPKLHQTSLKNNFNQTVSSNLNQTISSTGYYPQIKYESYLKNEGQQFNNISTQKISLTSPIYIREANFQKQDDKSDFLYKRILNQNKKTQNYIQLSKLCNTNSEGFKLKCINQRKLTYQAEIDQTDFSTLQLKKKSVINFPKNKQKYGKISVAHMQFLRGYSKPLSQIDYSISLSQFSRYGRKPVGTKRNSGENSNQA